MIVYFEDNKYWILKSEFLLVLTIENKAVVNIHVKRKQLTKLLIGKKWRTTIWHIHLTVLHLNGTQVNYIKFVTDS